MVVHINTLKGKGYAPAEQHKEQWHYNAPFDLKTGMPLNPADGEDYSSVTRDYLLKKMKEDFRKLKTEGEREKFIKETGSKLDGMTGNEIERLTDAVEVDLKEINAKAREILTRE